MYLYHCDHYQYHYALARTLVPHVKITWFGEVF